MIPRVIHQIWLGPKPPPRYTMETCRRLNPGWQYRVWTEDIAFPLINRRLFDSYADVWYAKADVLRYEVLHRFGGVYVDADQLCLRGFDDLLNDSTETGFFAGYQNLGNPDIAVDERSWTLIANGVIGAAPGHPILDGVIRAIGQDGGPDLRPWFRVGPGALTRAIAETASSAVIYPFHQFYPYHASERIPRRPAEMVKAIHYRSHSVSLWGSTVGSYRRCRVGPRRSSPSTDVPVPGAFAERHPVLAPIRVQGRSRALAPRPMFLSVIVCTHNRAPLLERTLQSLANQTMPPDRFEVIVVENGCTDASGVVSDRFTESRSNFRVIRLASPGKSRAANAGVNAARGTHLVFMDDDVCAPESWLDQFARAFAATKPAPAVVLGEVESVYETTPPRWWDLATAARPRKRGFVSDVYLVKGANFAVDRHAIAECGGFSEERGPHGTRYAAGEDTELVYRIAKRFPAVWYDPSLVVGHWVPTRNMTLRHTLRRAYLSGVGISDIDATSVISSLIPASLFHFSRLVVEKGPEASRGASLLVLMLLGARRLCALAGVVSGATGRLARRALSDGQSVLHYAREFVVAFTARSPGR